MRTKRCTVAKANRNRWKVGDVVRCIKSESVGYTKGSLYLVTEHPTLKVLALKSDDGLYDPLTLLLSQFKPEEKDQCKPDYLKIVKQETV